MARCVDRRSRCVWRLRCLRLLTLRPVALRPRLSTGLPFSVQVTNNCKPAPKRVHSSQKRKTAPGAAGTSTDTGRVRIPARYWLPGSGAIPLRSAFSVREHKPTYCKHHANYGFSFLYRDLRGQAWRETALRLAFRRDTTTVMAKTDYVISVSARKSNHYRCRQMETGRFSLLTSE